MCSAVTGGGSAVLDISGLWHRLPLSVAIIAIVGGALPIDEVRAQGDAEPSLEEIIVVGSRRPGRTAANTPVPVDVFNREDLDAVATDDMLDIIGTLVPSFLMERRSIDDGRTFIRPPELRGMSGDKVLVLVNNKRRHRSALVSTIEDGSNGPDLASIPAIAVKSIEVLRDGASAMYGSDAIAGVLNFNLRDSAESGELQVQTGEYTEGDETAYVVAVNHGVAIGNNGFINFSAELSDSEATSRGTFFDPFIGGLTPQEVAQVSGLFDHDGSPATPDQMRFGPDAWNEVYDPATGRLVSIVVPPRGVPLDGIPDDTDPVYANNLPFAEITNTPFVQVWGAPEREALRSFVNAGFELDNGTELYAWGNYSDSDTNGNFFHRWPVRNPLRPVRLETGEIWSGRSIYPAGFTPRFAGNVVDKSMTGGVRGEFVNGLTYDVSGRWGENQLNYTLFNTLNPSLGPATPTSFRPGGLISDESAVAADFTLPVDVGFASDLNVAFGVEFRDEGYDLLQGDPLSWEIGPYAFSDPFNFEITDQEVADRENDNWFGTGLAAGCYIPGNQGTAYFGAGPSPGADTASGQFCTAGDPIYNAAPIGSDGFAGYPPSGVSSYSRHSWAAYVDLEADITDNFLATVAGRYEDFSDFGSNFSWRVAALWRINDVLRLRASAGTGFRAPTPGQLSTINIRTTVTTDTPLEIALLPADHPVAAFKGATPLDAETSTQFTLGVTATPFDALTITLDYYFIALDDQIWVSSNMLLDDAERTLLQTTVSGVRYFTNDIDTESSGIDLVATYDLDWSGGSTVFSLAGNMNDFKVTRRTDRRTDPADPPEFFVNDTGVFRAENGSPEYRFIFLLRHSWDNDISASLRANWYGNYELAEEDFSDGSVAQTQTMGGVVYLDAEVSWDVGELLNVTLGANNVFNEFPDRNPCFSFCVGQVYDANSVMDWQGRFVYLRGALRW